MMTTPTSITILGGPDAGKSNYIGALWLRLRGNQGRFRIPFEPENIRYVEGIVGELREGRYPPRTEPDEGEATFVASISLETDPETPVATIQVPDMIGEIWKAASRDREIDPIWIEQLRRSSCAMVFVRFGSRENVEMADWVTSARMMRFGVDDDRDGGDEGGAPADADGVAAVDEDDGDGQAGGRRKGVPTQLFLCDLVNILEEHLGRDTAVQRPRVALMIAAWDGVGTPERQAGPARFVETDYPMLDGRLADDGRLDVRIFGVSATGFDLKIPEQRDQYLKVGPSKAGFAEAVVDGGVVSGDLLMPLAWALDRENG